MDIEDLTSLANANMRMINLTSFILANEEMILDALVRDGKDIIADLLIRRCKDVQEALK